MILVTHGPLEGVPICLCRTLPRWTGIHEEMISLDLHEGLKPKDGCRDPMPGERS
jgi:hypothetical protein